MIKSSLGMKAANATINQKIKNKKRLARSHEPVVPNPYEFIFSN
jgi:hypothetical protein